MQTLSGDLICIIVSFDEKLRLSLMMTSTLMYQHSLHKDYWGNTLEGILFAKTALRLYVNGIEKKWLVVYNSPRKILQTLPKNSSLNTLRVQLRHFGEMKFPYP